MTTRPGKRSTRRLVAVGAVLALLAAGGFAALRARVLRKPVPESSVYTVVPRDLLISVRESGNLESTNAYEVKSKVEGRGTIISIIPDGTVLTKEDVEKGRVLVELDSSALREKAAQQEIKLESARADLSQAKESYEIQVKQNESNVSAGELKVKFARMDFERYLGKELADKILKGERNISALSLGELSAEEAAKRIEELGLGGAALKQWKELHAAIQFAGEEVERALDKYKWSARLAEKGYVTSSEAKADELAWKRRQSEHEQAQLALDIFLRYELPKEAEKLYSDVFEAERELERIHAKARAELAQAESRLKAKEAAFQLQRDTLKKLKEQIEFCTIRAPRPGMVVYASTTNWRGQTQNVIEEGAEIRERQVIMRIPDPGGMSVKVRVSESNINKVRVGQKARVIAEPFPERTFWGKVAKVAVTPDATRWFAGDIRTYTTEIRLDKPAPELKPGMTAQVEILVSELKNVLAVPVQAVSPLEGLRVCYVLASRRAEARPVETGQANDTFIEIKSGLRPGERVLLYKPDVYDDSLVKLAAKKRQRQKSAVEVAAAPPAPAPENKPHRVADESTAEAAEETPAWLQRVPEDRREEMLKRWKAMSDEERRTWSERMREHRRPGGGGRSGPPAEGG